MNPPTATEIGGIRAALENTLWWKCKILTPLYGSGDDDTDPIPEQWGEGAEIPCGFRATVKGEAPGGSQATQSDGVVRLPIGTDIDASCRILMTATPHGDSADELYAVVGEPSYPMGACVHVRVVRVTSESVT
jgi:hypothetical protein